jgi:hypothetical protein
VTNTKLPFCPIYGEMTDKNGKKYIEKTDECMIPTEKKDLSNNENDQSILIPYIDLNCEFFLKKYYDIYTFEQAIDWINDKKYTSLRTRNRIMECAWNTFGENLDILDQRITNFYLDLIKKKWIYEIMNDLEEYLYIDDETKTIILKKTDKNDKNKDKLGKNTVEKINFLIDKFVTRDDIYKFLIRYLKYRKSMWENIKNHNIQIFTDFKDYIKNKILTTIN